MMTHPPASVHHPPRLSPEDALRISRDLFALDALAASPLPSERDQNFRLRAATGEEFVLKLSQTNEDPGILECQNAILARLAGAGASGPFRFPRPRRSRAGREIEAVRATDGAEHLVRLLDFLPGVPLAELGAHPPVLLEDVGRMLGSVDRALDGFDHPAADRELHWDLRRGRDVVRRHLAEVEDAGRRRLVEHGVASFDAHAASLLPSLRTGVIHGDGNDWNVLVAPGADPPDAPRVVGLVDFGDVVRSWTCAEPAIAAAYAMLGKPDPLAAAAHVVRGYHAEHPLTEPEIAALFPLILLRLCTSVVLAEHQRRLRPENAYLSVSEQGAWELLHRLAEVDPRAAHQRLREACGPGPLSSAADVASLLERRRRSIGPNLSVSYRTPLHIVRGWMQYLYDDAGRAYLDGVNNVAHVGHSHPRVVEALVRQSRVLNTNTRYLHENLVAYAERLTATLPEPLRVCFFTCSGSEANELALRLARTHTGRRDVVVLDAAYHGNTSSLVDVSPYKFDGPGGAGAPPGTHVVPLPDPFRGLYRGEDTGPRYAEHVLQATTAAALAGPGVAAFIAEPLPGCGGQIVLPDGFLREAFRHVREAGGVCIADEVQVGFGRVGTHVWGFETHGVVPDIVTLGKPIGNGHPMGAVVTTPQIAASFANGMEYFNTFGGNPVSCAVGLAVLDVIEEEQLQARALRVGERLKAGLRALMPRHPTVGDVRGLGLFLGIELVRDPETREPAPRAASRVVERLCDLGILLSTDGPAHDVLKIKPPLQFSEEDADRLVEALDGILSEAELPRD